MLNPQFFHGHEINVISPFVVEVEVRRTWKERLLTLPFRPLLKIKTRTEFVEQMKDGETYIYKNKIMMNAATHDKLISAMTSTKNER